MVLDYYLDFFLFQKLLGILHKSVKQFDNRPDLEVIKTYFMPNLTMHGICSAHNIKVPTVGILTFISRINTTNECCYKQEGIYIFQYFRFYEQLKFHAQLS